MATRHDSPDPDEGAWFTGPATRQPPQSHRFRLPRWRVFTWFILAFNAFMLAWVIDAIASYSSTCDGLTGDTLTNCEAGNVGVGLAATWLFVLWALGDVILGVLWLITRPRTRMCPVCGSGVSRGMTRCRRCGYDFAHQLRAQPPPPDWVQPVAPRQRQPGPPGEARGRRSGR